MANNLKRLTLGIAILSALLLLIAGPGTRLGLWAYGTGFLLMRVAFFAGLAAAALGLLFLIIPKTRAAGVIPLAIALLLGVATAYVPWNGVRTARSLPFIHDITTDTTNPPAFVAILPLRADAPNPAEYLGEEVAQQQRDGYPDLKPMTLAQPVGAAFDQALELAKSMGWEIVAAEAAEGRIEATDTTFWFGFKDDVVIRIGEDRGGSRLDMRSKSRVGRSDVGANAERIRAFMVAMGK
ncbi:MAG: DUF1499 domain-containing protein [Pseudomonadota bacterium]